MPEIRFFWLDEIEDAFEKVNTAPASKAVARTCVGVWVRTGVAAVVFASSVVLTGGGRPAADSKPRAAACAPDSNGRADVRRAIRREATAARRFLVPVSPSQADLAADPDWF